MTIDILCLVATELIFNLAALGQHALSLLPVSIIPSSFFLTSLLEYNCFTMVC